MAKTASIIFFVLALFFCTIRSVAQVTDDLELPRPPQSMTSVIDRADYVLAHFWDNLGVNPGRVDSEQWLEQWVVNYLSLLPHASVDGRCAAHTSTVRTFSERHDVLLRVNRLMEKYLDEPESDMFSEEYYIEYLEQLLHSGVLNDYERVRPDYRLGMLKKNRVGDKAVDFRFVDRTGAPDSLYGVKSPMLLLVIYDPECDHCAEVIRKLTESQTLSDAIASRRLEVLAVFADGEADAWTAASQSLPPDWLGGLDVSGLQQNDLYAVRDLPSIYLLGADKTVLLKEPSLEQIEMYINTK